jgi:hypothetical protein
MRRPWESGLALSPRSRLELLVLIEPRVELEHPAKSRVVGRIDVERLAELDLAGTELLGAELEESDRRVEVRRDRTIPAPIHELLLAFGELLLLGQDPRREQERPVVEGATLADRALEIGQRLGLLVESVADVRELDEAGTVART